MAQLPRVDYNPCILYRDFSQSQMRLCLLQFVPYLYLTSSLITRLYPHRHIFLLLIYVDNPNARSTCMYTPRKPDCLQLQPTLHISSCNLLSAFPFSEPLLRLIASKSAPGSKTNQPLTLFFSTLVRCKQLLCAEATTVSARL